MLLEAVCCLAEYRVLSVLLVQQATVLAACDWLLIIQGSSQSDCGLLATAAILGVKPQ